MKKIGNCDIKSLAEQFGTPLYVYNKSRIEDNFHLLDSTFNRYYPKTKVHFSVKANSNLNILNVFREIGSGADCSSPFEVLLAKKAGFNSEKILYTGNYESPEDFSVIETDKMRLNLDDGSSLARLLQVKKPEIISFRINPGIGRGGYEGITTAGSDAKFGVPYEKAYEVYKNAKENGIDRFGIHMMTGSNNLEPYYFAEIVDKLMIIAGDIFSKLGAVPEYIDIGGGFGVPYEDDEQPLDVDLTAKLVTEIFIEKCKKYGFGTPDLVLEPGRFLIANAGYLIAKVTGIKHSYKTFVGLDAGMGTLLRPALYGARHRMLVYGKEEPTIHANICGQICENSDIFAKGMMIPEVEEGDLVTFLDAGAYGYAMASNYNNRPRPAEVIINGGDATIIRRRETFEDLIRLY